MYQLSHFLIEQRNLLSALKEDSLPENQRHAITEDDENLDEDGEQESPEKKVINAIKESMVNYKGNLDSKTFIHDGGLIELDANDYHPVCLTHLILFTDCLIITKIRHEQKLEFIKQYDVKKIAMTNIKRGVQNGINIITPDGTKIFQCKNLAGKNEWLEKFDAAIKYNPTGGVKPSKKGPAPLPPPLQKQASIIADRKSIASDILSPTDSMSVAENLAPEWLTSAPEEIQSQIAQRHFEDALAVIQKCEEFYAKDKTFHNATEVIEKIKALKTDLCQVLINELSNAQSRSLQAALRSSRRALKLLAEMGKAREACGTLLRVCTTAIRTAQRQARRNNLAVSEVFFCDLAQVASEFLRVFSAQAACTSALIVWCNIELQYFASQLIKHYLTKGTQLESVAKVVEGVRQPCSNLTQIGLDLSYHMEGLLRNTVEQLIEESRFRLIESTGRATDEAWQPYNLQTKSNLKQMLKDMEALGIDMRPQVTGDTWINLTQSTVTFCRHFLTVTEQCAILAKYESLKSSAEILLRDLFLAQQSIKPNATVNVDVSGMRKMENIFNFVLFFVI